MPLFRIRRFYLYVAIGLLVAISIGAFATRPNEPSYKGHPLGYWLDRMPAIIVKPSGESFAIAPSWAIAEAGNESVETPAGREKLNQVLHEAETAVNELGTNCLPNLIRRMGSDDSQIKWRLANWAGNMHLVKQHPFENAETERGQALAALLRLNRRAAPAVPELLALAKNRDLGVQATAQYALEHIAQEEYRKWKAQDGKK